jgi:hypothetical protein
VCYISCPPPFDPSFITARVNFLWHRSKRKLKKNCCV